MDIREIFAEKIAEENLRIEERKEREKKQQIKLEQALKEAKEEIVNLVSAAQSSNFAFPPNSSALIGLVPINLYAKEGFKQSYDVGIGCTVDGKEVSCFSKLGTINIELDYLFSFSKIDLSKLFEEEKATFVINEDSESPTYLFIFK